MNGSVFVDELDVGIEIHCFLLVSVKPYSYARFVCLFACLFACLCVCLFACLLVCLVAGLLLCFFVSLFLCSFVFSFVYEYIYCPAVLFSLVMCFIALLF